MSKSRPYVVEMILPANELSGERTITIVNAISQAQAQRHALKPHQPAVMDCRPATALEMAKLQLKGVRFEDATGDPELNEAPLDVSALGDERERGGGE